MNNLNTSVTSAFLKQLETQKDSIRTVSPLVIFRRILGVSENPTARDIVAALQQASSRVNRLAEMQKNFSSASLIGEIISFDIGPAQKNAWFKFSVLREPLQGDGNQMAINFAVDCTDKVNGKRYHRIIGAMQRETDAKGNKSSVFRLINDICEVEEIEKQVEEKPVVVKDMHVKLIPTGDMIHIVADDNMVGEFKAPRVLQMFADYIVQRDFTATELATLDAETILKGITPVDVVLLTKGMGPIYLKVENECIAVLDETDKKIGTLLDPDTDTFTPNEHGYMVKEDIRVSDVMNKSLSEICESLETITPHTLFKKGDIVEISEITNDHITFKCGADVEVTIPEGRIDENVFKMDLKYVVSDDITIVGNITSEALKLFAVRLRPMEQIVVSKDELINFQGQEGTYKANKDLTQREISEIVASGKIDEFFTKLLPEPPAEVPVPETPAEETTHQEETPKPDPDVLQKEKEIESQDMNTIVYTKGEIITVFGADGYFRVNEDVTRGMLDEVKGNVAQFLTPCTEDGEPIDVVAKPTAPITEPTNQGSPAEETAPAEAPAAEAPAEEAPAEEAPSAPAEPEPVGELPNQSLVKDEHSKGDYLRMLFGTANPNILHVFGMLRKYANNDTFKKTGCWPVEQMIAMPDYSFSIVKMKNGRFYRIYVAHTDKENLNDSTWLETCDVPDRWLQLIDVQDHEIGRMLDTRERRR